ncbi:putative motility protein [Alteribacter keqinensis]|uniref:Putative motility protein n=1 Tax=Alteribacter keqinensis TaxID=2483800 RepID=A0A3M7TYH5_9BACI|nr:putative motility protein [Alteribacter keqinensis]RNA70670.1 putative motility protein [Alteribacter keqinensis]
MKISSMMATQTLKLQQTLNISLMKSALNSDAAMAVSMLDRLRDGTQQNDTATTNPSPHPALGKKVDIRL